MKGNSRMMSLGAQFVLCRTGLVFAPVELAEKALNSDKLLPSSITARLRIDEACGVEFGP